MDKDLSFEELKERVKKLRERMRAKNEAEKKEVKEKREEEIKRFLILVVEEFEREVQSLESEIGLVPKLVKRFHTSLDVSGFDEVVGELEKMGFVIEHFEKSPSGWIDVVLYEKPKKRTGPGSSI